MSPLVSTQKTREDDVREMIAVACDVLDLPAYLVAPRVVMSWRDGITIADWLRAVIPPEQKIGTFPL